MKLMATSKQPQIGFVQKVLPKLIRKPLVSPLKVLSLLRLTAQQARLLK